MQHLLGSLVPSLLLLILVSSLTLLLLGTTDGDQNQLIVKHV